MVTQLLVVPGGGVPAAVSAQIQGVYVPVSSAAVTAAITRLGPIGVPAANQGT
jgi:hypothetical protein